MVLSKRRPWGTGGSPGPPGRDRGLRRSSEARGVLVRTVSRGVLSPSGHQLLPTAQPLVLASMPSWLPSLGIVIQETVWFVQGDLTTRGIR